MCNMIVLSTTSTADLTRFNSRYVVFSRDLPDLPELTLLQYENRWYLGSRDGCSCGFRHLLHENVVLGFSEPLDWYPETDEDIASTIEAVVAFKAIISDDSRLDCIDAWASNGKGEPVLSGQDRVDLALVPTTSFRFYEGHRFVIVDSSVPNIPGGGTAPTPAS